MSAAARPDDVALEQRPPVTVIVATRDRPELLRLTLQAIADQDYRGVVETMVVFDRSDTDESVVSADERRPVRVITNQRRAGLQGARNSGIEATDAPLIAFCDDDDVWQPNKLSAQVDLLDAHPEVGFVTTGIEICYGDIRRPRPAGQGRVQRSQLIRSRTIEATHPSTFLFRRTLLDQMGLIDEDVPGGYGEDYEFLLRATRYTDLLTVEEPCVQILWHRQSFYAERWQMRIDGLSYVLDQHPDINDDDRGLARIRGQIAFARAALGERSGARRDALATLRLTPREQRAWLALLVSTRLVSADRVVQLVQRTGRSI